MSFLVYREIAIVYLLCREPAQIFLVIITEKRQVVVQKICIFFFEHVPKPLRDGVALFVVSFVIAHFVNKKQRQSLDALAEKHFLFGKMRLDGFAYLHALKGLFTHIAHHVALAQTVAILKNYRVLLRDNVCNHTIAIFLQVLGGNIQVVILVEQQCASVYSRLVIYVDFQFHLWRMAL